MWYLFEESFSNIRHGGFVSLLSVVIVTLTVTIASALILIGNYLQGKSKTLRTDQRLLSFLRTRSVSLKGRNFAAKLRSSIGRLL